MPDALSAEIRPAHQRIPEVARRAVFGEIGIRIRLP
jgi:hypothetical protein